MKTALQFNKHISSLTKGLAFKTLHEAKSHKVAAFQTKVGLVM